MSLIGRRTFDQAVAVSAHGRGAIESPRSAQPSIPPGLVNRVPASDFKLPIVSAE